MREKIYFTYDITFDIVEDFINNEPDEYDLYFATNGGDGYASIYFANYLKKSKKLKDIVCIGEVNSGGTIILASLNKIKKRKAYDYVSFLVHLLRLDINLSDISMSYLRDVIKTTSNLNNIILDIYSNNLNLSDEDKILLVNGVDLIWTPEVAQKKGLIDEIIEM